VDECGRGVEAFLHPAGEALRALVGDLGEIDESEQLLDPFAPLASGHAVGRTGELEVFAGGEFLIDADLLGHVTDRLADLPGLAFGVEPVDEHLPVRRLQQRRQHLDRGRLSRAVRT
jgi:hypothetical protein